MNIGATFETNAQTAKLMQPGMCALHHPPRDTQAAAMFDTPARDYRNDAARLQGSSMRLGIIAAVSLQCLRFPFWTSYLARDWGNAIDQRNELSDIVVVSGRKDRIQRNALRVRDEVVLATRTTAIGWVRSSFFPAPTARIEELSAMAREKSNWSAPRSFDSSTLCSRSHTPRRCHSLSRRQQVIPEPHPISLGSISQGMPDLNTNKIPVTTRRLHNGFRPVYRLRRRFLGNSGSISAHKSSSISGCGIVSPDGHTMPHRTNAAKKVQDSFC